MAECVVAYNGGADSARIGRWRSTRCAVVLPTQGACAPGDVRPSIVRRKEYNSRRPSATDMQRPSLLVREVAPFLAMFAALIGAAILLDAGLHLADLVWVGRYLGIPGTLLILFSFVYSLRKRKFIAFGKTKTFLTVHQVSTLAGAVMVLVHAGIHVYALLPWLALAAMLVNVISGLTGQFLLARSRRYLEEGRAAYADQGLSEESIEKRLFRDATAFELMKKWRAVHLPITLAFAVAALAHILSIFLFWQWR